MPPSLFPAIVRPIDEGWYTTFLRASETHLLPEAELSDARRQMSPEQYASEFECDPYAAIQGAYYGRDLAAAEAEGRLLVISGQNSDLVASEAMQPLVDRSLLVHTAWELGIGDSTAIWFWQAIGDEVRVIDYYESHGKGLDHYASELESRGYWYGKDYVPHDAKMRELGTGKARVETLVALGRKPSLISQHKIMDGINAARLVLPKCWFDAKRCKDGLEALRQYRCDFDEKQRVFREAPRHDWTSHAADAFRFLRWHGGRSSKSKSRRIRDCLSPSKK